MDKTGGKYKMNRLIIVITIIVLILLWYLFIAPRFYGKANKLEDKMRELHIKQMKKIIEEFNIEKRELYGK